MVIMVMHQRLVEPQHQDKVMLVVVLLIILMVRLAVVVLAQQVEMQQMVIQPQVAQAHLLIHLGEVQLQLVKTQVSRSSSLTTTIT